MRFASWYMADFPIGTYGGPVPARRCLRSHANFFRICVAASGSESKPAVEGGTGASGPKGASRERRRATRSATASASQSSSRLTAVVGARLGLLPKAVPVLGSTFGSDFRGGSHLELYGFYWDF